MCQKTHSFAVLTRSFFDATQRLNKNCSSTFHGVMFLFHTYWDFFLLTDIFQGLEAICCPPLWSTTFVSLIWQTMYFRSLSFSTREIKCVYLPGHLETFGLHSSVSVSFPSLEQSLPPFAGSGLSHSLSRLLVPFLLPQVTEHSLHFPHWPYPPSAAKYTQQVFNHAQ